MGWAQPGRAPLCPRGTAGSGDGSKPGTELVGRHARCLATGPAFIVSIYSPSTKFPGESEAHHSVRVVFLSLFWTWKKMGFLWANPPLHQYSHVADSGSGPLEGRAASRGREKQRSWCCSFPQPVTCEWDSPRRTDKSPRGTEGWRGADCPWSCGYGPPLALSTSAHQSACQQHQGQVHTWHKQVVPDARFS